MATKKEIEKFAVANGVYHFIQDFKFRRTGDTTRNIDNAIQELFTTGSCKIRDHDEQYSKVVLKKVLDRLFYEHFESDIDQLIKDKKIIIDTKKISIIFEETFFKLMPHNLYKAWEEAKNDTGKYDTALSVLIKAKEEKRIFKNKYSLKNE
jgi:hypothetical protein